MIVGVGTVLSLNQLVDMKPNPYLICKMPESTQQVENSSVFRSLGTEKGKEKKTLVWDGGSIISMET